MVGRLDRLGPPKLSSKIIIFYQEVLGADQFSIADTELPHVANTIANFEQGYFIQDDRVNMVI
ncbi:MAG: hypothetical protein QNJ53_13895 [Pleurocapsa sp. MO_192.B19]|nr:hypothetical protein [Pleurocapsa sp. MO_192.B19]